MNKQIKETTVTSPVDAVGWIHWRTGIRKEGWSCRSFQQRCPIVCGGKEKGRRHDAPARAGHSAHRGQEGGNRLISGFEGQKKKCKFDLVDRKQDGVARRKVVFAMGVCKSRTRRPRHKPGDKTHQAKKQAGLDVLCEGRTITKQGWKRRSTWACSQVHRVRGRDESGRCCNTSSWSTSETSLFSWLASTHCLTDCPGFCKLVTGFNKKHSFATVLLADWVTNISIPVELQVIHWANPFSPRCDSTCGRIWPFLT